MKPLYYALLPDRLLFAAEIKSLLADSAVPRDPDPRGISQFFSFGQLFGEDTLLRAVKVLSPAAWVTYRQAEREFQIDRYWQLSDIKVDPQLSHADFLERIDTAFAKAVELRTNDTAALGISLSGGLDSRSILAAIDHRQTPIKSVSMGMRGSLDHRCAQQLAAASNGDHFCYLLDDRFLSTLRALHAHHGASDRRPLPRPVHRPPDAADVSAARHSSAAARPCRRTDAHGQSLQFFAGS